MHRSAVLHLKEICECTEPLRGSFQSQTTGACNKIEYVHIVKCRGSEHREREIPSFSI